MQAPFDPVQRAYDRLRAAQRAAPNPSLAEREDRLERLDALLVEHRDDFARAAASDFGRRTRAETLIADVFLTLDGVRYARKHVKAWMTRRPERAHPFFLPSKAFVEFLPLGVVGIIAPWNYPVNLALSPLAAALAAGNRALVKPSELTPATSEVLASAVAGRFSGDEVAVVTGGPEVARALTALPLDHLLFTGSTAVGKLVAQAAAKSLTPVTLELGGKSPTLIHPSYDLAQAAERIIVGKLFNGGQTCIAPDYVLVERGSEQRLLVELRRAVERFYPRLEGFTSVINEKALHRLEAHVADARAKGAQVEPLSDVSPGARVLPPVALLGVNESMTAMQEELFGPVLPIETFGTLDEALARITSRPHPLAFYYFDDDGRRVDDVLSRVTSGGACVNDTLVHFAQEALPFGGVGMSGMGAYHGREGFEAFSHARSVVVASRLAPARTLMAPPYPAFIEKALGLLVQGVRGLSR
ncbi:MAG: aldehyde dehydrogenase family protein [Myxococcaceae bacterium]|nr:aldehyde dehydrogenase family protein [Myxococcaceae bacterium]